MPDVSSLHFIRPEFLWGILPLAIALWLFAKQNTAQSNWQSIGDAHLIQSLIVNIGKKTKQVTLTILFLLGAIMLIALAGPSFRKQANLSFSKQQAIVIALDMSTAMNASDIKPSRLSRAKFKIKDLLSELPDTQVGLVVFSKESFLVSPLTTDHNTLFNLLNELTPQIMPIDGSNIADPLIKASELIKQGGYDTGNIIVFTANAATPADINQAKILTTNKIKTSIIGTATTLGAPVYDAYHQSLNQISRLDPESLEALANAGKGIYLPFNSTSSDIQQLTAFLNKQQADYKKENNHQVIWQDDGRYLIFILVPLALLCFRRGFMESL